jgi:hypothetical protein
MLLERGLLLYEEAKVTTFIPSSRLERLTGPELEDAPRGEDLLTSRSRP